MGRPNRQAGLGQPLGLKRPRSRRGRLVIWLIVAFESALGLRGGTR